MPVYTPIIAPADLNTKIYPEVQAVITRGDASISIKAISSAISEVKMYLSKYDLVAMFGSVTGNTAATYQDEFLTDLVKSVATWHLIRLANPSVDVAITRSGYEDAISSLKKIQAGLCQPDGWPYLQTINPNIPEGDAIEWTARRKRHNYFY